MHHEMILSQNHRASFGLKDNSNIFVLGQVGSGKTRSHILPNIMEQDNVSMVIADTKGELRAKTEEMLREKEYVIKSIDFDCPSQSKDQFNPFMYIQSPEDILMMSSIIVGSQTAAIRSDPYWDNAALLLLQSCIAYLNTTIRPTDQTLTSLQRLICAFAPNDEVEYKSSLEVMFDDLALREPDCFAVQQWRSFGAIKGVAKTASTICSVLLSTFAQVLTPGIAKLTATDTLDFASIGQRKTALFVSVSDVDRSKDRLVSLFYSLLLNTLRNEADRCDDKGLPVHVHFFLDDFATNVCIYEFPTYISSLRSREISFSIVVQSEEQLQRLYGCNASTIIANCAYYLFLGSCDLKCCQDIARRMNIPLDKVLYKPRDKVFVLSHFARPLVDEVYSLTKHPRYHKLSNEETAISLAV